MNSPLGAPSSYCHTTEERNANDLPRLSPRTGVDDLVQQVRHANIDATGISPERELQTRHQQSLNPSPIHSEKNPQKTIDYVQNLLLNKDELNEQKLRKIYEGIFLFAGRTSLTPRFCSICLNQDVLAKSHIIPNNILSRLNSSFILAMMPNEKRTAENASWKLFCKTKCEIDRLSKCGETGFSDVFHDFISDVVKARSNKTSATLVTTNPSIHYCIASIIFRHIIVNGKRELEPYIKEDGSKVEEAFWKFFFLLRSYVLDKNSAQRPHIQLFINEKELQKNTLTCSISTTESNDSRGCYTTGHFSLKGFHFLVVESQQFMQTHTSDLTLPPVGFSETITFEPQTIEVRPQHILTLPKIVTQALELDLMIFQKTLLKINGAYLASQSPTSAVELPRVALPIHPLITDLQKFYESSLMTIRLPDEISFEKEPRGTIRLVFVKPEKYEIFFNDTRPSFQILFIRNNLAKQSFVVINSFNSECNIVYGFLVDQMHFQKSNFLGLQAALDSCDNDKLKDFLRLSPLSKTDHLGIESTANSFRTTLLIATSITHFWLKDIQKQYEIPLKVLRAPYKEKLYHFIDLQPIDSQDSDLQALRITREQVAQTTLEHINDRKVMELIAKDNEECIIEWLVDKLEDIRKEITFNPHSTGLLDMIAYCNDFEIHVWIADKSQSETLVHVKRIGNEQTSLGSIHHILYDEKSKTFHKLGSLPPIRDTERKDYLSRLLMIYLAYSLGLGSAHELEAKRNN